MSPRKKKTDDEETALIPAPDLVLTAVDRVFKKSKLTVESFQADLRQIALMSAINGDFKSAVAGMEVLGKTMDVFTPVVKQGSQHIHLHNTEIRELSADDIQARLNMLKSAHPQVDVDDD